MTGFFGGVRVCELKVEIQEEYLNLIRSLHRFSGGLIPVDFFQLSVLHVNSFSSSVNYRDRSCRDILILDHSQFLRGMCGQFIAQTPGLSHVL